MGYTQEAAEKLDCERVFGKGTSDSCQ